MELLLIASRPDKQPQEMRVEVDPATPARELVTEMATALGMPANSEARVVRIGATLPPDLPVGSVRLVHGDHIELSAPGSVRFREDATPPAAFELAIVGGPNAGVRYPLQAGAEYTIGRAGTDIVIDDTQASRVHAHLGVGSRQVVVTDAGSTNGTFLDGRRLAEPTPVEPGRVIEIGSTLLEVVPVSSKDATANLTWEDGREAFSRPPRVATPDRSETISVPVPPRPPGKRKIPLVAALIPILMGAVMAYFAGPIMLLFALLSPIMMLFTFWEDSRSGRRTYVKQRASFDREMSEIEGRVASSYGRLLTARRAAAPNMAELTEWVRALSPRLWERRPADEDFLCLRVGTTDLPSRLTVDIPNLETIDDEIPEPAEYGRVRALAQGHSIDPGVPADVGLVTVGVLGVAGEEDTRAALVRWLVVQAATLHSPRDLAIVGLLPSSDAHRKWGWMRWLPHAETLLQGLPSARSVATSAEDVRALCQVVDDLIATRRLRSERDVRYATPHPWVLVVIPEPTVISAPTLSRLMADGPAFGVSFVVGATRSEQLPGECQAVVSVGTGEADASVTVTASGDTMPGIIVDGIPLDLTTVTAQRLAPLKDAAAATASGEVPRRVLLLDTLGMPNPDPDQIQQRWATNAGTGELRAPIGEGAAGPVAVDLRRDGPHGLTAGTTGSGKSELLLSYIGALASTYPASTLTFVLVDYKGGAAFADCVALPHTVGFFTDLDPHLAQRALVSLNAELKRREHILSEHGCKDLVDLERRNPDAAPANLFIVFDEFAFLKKEVPEFVAGVIDIAQRGRSLGVHLMLATQRPAGVIDDNIRANTNLRIALRMASTEESTDVLDRDDAAMIPKSLPGRGYVRVGHSDVTLVQSAYANARSVSSGAIRQPTKVAPFDVASGLYQPTKRRRRSAEPDHRPTDLQRLVEAIREAHVQAGIPDQPRPWLNPLAELDDLVPVFATDPPPEASEVAAPIGRRDLPEEQSQDVGWYDPAHDGPLLIYGTGGTGKTQTLRTIAASVSQRSAPDVVNIYGLDFGGRGLTPLTTLPQVGAVVSADEPERIDRLFGVLASMVAERTEILGAAHASSLAEYRAGGGELPYVVVLLDGYGAFRQAYLNVDRGELVDQLDHLVSQGRTVGLTFVITADRRNAVPTSLSSAISNRLVLRMADGDEYASLGLPSSLAQATLTPGRGFWNRDEVQIGVLGTDPSGAGQAQSLKLLGDEIAGRIAAADAGATRPLAITLLPEMVSVAQVPFEESTRERVPLGLSGDTYRPVALDLLDTPVFLVLGTDRSGRTTTLDTVTAGLMAAEPGLEAYLLAPRRTPLSNRPWWRESARGVEASEALARKLEDRLREKEVEPDGPWLIVIDDGDELADSLVSGSLDLLIRRSRDVDLTILAAVQTHTAQRAFGGWITSMRKSRQGLILDPQVDVDGDLFGLRLPRKASRRFPPGRGYLVSRGPVEYVQVAVMG